MINEPIYLDNIESVESLLNQLEQIDQPLNTQLSSLLQLCCLLSPDADVIEYLLEKGANPDYSDIRGWNAFDYALQNKTPYASVLICSILEGYRKEPPQLLE